MSKPSFEELQRLLRELILPFYEIERDLSLPIQNHRNENDAEHSWGLALMGIALAPQIDPKLDTGKIAIFATIHDLVEVFAGDTSVWAADKKLATKEARERKALQEIKKRFATFPNIAKNIESYDKKDSPEAKFVFALDKFLALLTLYSDEGYYYKKNKITKERFEKQFALHRKKAHSHPDIAKYYEQLRTAIDTHPEFFHKP